MTEERRFLARVAELYYKSGLNQEEISRQLGLSRSMISRLLTKAIQKGVVEVIIHYPDDRDRDLETRLKAAFGLDDALVATTGAGNGESEHAAIYVLAAEYIQEHLEGGKALGVAWGRAVAGVYRAMKPKRKIPGLKVVQAFGSAMPNQEIDGAAIIGGMAALFGGAAVYLHTPLHVGSREVRDSLLRDPNIRSVIELAETVDLLITGIGDVGATEAAGNNWLHYLSKKEENALRKMGTVGHVCTRHYDIRGKFLDSPAYDGIIGVSHEKYMRIPYRIGVAWGSGKVRAILGAVRGKYVNVLITDADTARKVLALHDAAGDESA